MAPEYALDGQFSVKSDVFSFGQKNICFRNGKKVEDLTSFVIIYTNSKQQSFGVI